MATKKQSSAKQSKPESVVADSTETLTGLPNGGLIISDENENGEAFGVPALHVELAELPAELNGHGIDVFAPAIDFAALESRVARAEQGYAAAVASVGTTADELREARAALREARGG